MALEATAVELLLGALLVLLGLVGVGVAALLRRTRDGRGEARLEALASAQLNTQRAVTEELARSREAMAAELSRSRHELGENTRHLRLDVTGAVGTMAEGVGKRLDDARSVMDARLREIHAENAKQLDAVRATVDEKLQGTLEERLGAAFKQVSERLEAVHKGLGEMQTLAEGVGNLERMLTNVKTRGTWGEMQLANLLEQMLTPGQYEANVAVRPRAAERVDFALKLPGTAEDGGTPVWLPIDAKFPQEDHARIIEAHERGDATAAEASARALEQAVMREGRRIRDKYISPPATTDFAILFVPTEGLYAEILRRAGLIDRLQRECRVTIAGPTTLMALLTSLQMGFRTLAIQKRSGEVWKLLGAVKTQFGQFSELLDRVGKKLEEASNTVGEASRKTATIQKRLGKVELLPGHEAAEILPLHDEDPVNR